MYPVLIVACITNINTLGVFICLFVCYHPSRNNYLFSYDRFVFNIYLKVLDLKLIEILDKDNQLNFTGRDHFKSGWYLFIKMNQGTLKLSILEVSYQQAWINW